MENQKITTVKTALNFGIILGGVSLVYSLMLFFLDMHYQGDSTTSVIGYLIFIIIVFWAIKDFKKAIELGDQDSIDHLELLLND